MNEDEYLDVLEADPVLAATRTEHTRRNFWNHHSFMYLQEMIDQAQAEARNEFIRNEFGMQTAGNHAQDGS